MKNWNEKSMATARKQDYEKLVELRESSMTYNDKRLLLTYYAHALVTLHSVTAKAIKELEEFAAKIGIDKKSNLVSTLESEIIIRIQNRKTKFLANRFIIANLHINSEEQQELAILIDENEVLRRANKKLSELTDKESDENDRNLIAPEENPFFDIEMTQYKDEALTKENLDKYFASDRYKMDTQDLIDSGIIADSKNDNLNDEELPF